MTARIHQLTSAQIEEKGSIPTSAPPKGGNGGDHIHHFPGAKDDAKSISRTARLAHSDEKIRRMLVFFLVVMALSSLTEFGASFAANWASKRDGFNQFHGSYPALIGISLVTTFAYILIALVIALALDKKSAIGKVIALICYLAVVVWMGLLIAPEIIPTIKNLMDSGSTGNVFSGVGTTAGNEDGTKAWLLYLFTALAAFMVTAPGLVFIWAKFGYGKWVNIRECCSRAANILAVEETADTHRAKADEANKVVSHFTDITQVGFIIDSALKQSRDVALRTLQEKKARFVSILNNGMTPNVDKAAAHAEIKRLDICIQSVESLSI
jgi:hypothetical protein